MRLHAGYLIASFDLIDDWIAFKFNICTIATIDSSIALIVLVIVVQIETIFVQKLLGVKWIIKCLNVQGASLVVYFSMILPQKNSERSTNSMEQRQNTA